MSQDRAKHNWVAVFHNGDTLTVEAHEFEITEEGDLVFINCQGDANSPQEVIAAASRGCWRNIQLVAPPVPPAGHVAALPEPGDYFSSRAA